MKVINKNNNVYLRWIGNFNIIISLYKKHGSETEPHFKLSAYTFKLLLNPNIILHVNYLPTQYVYLNSSHLAGNMFSI